MDPCCDPCGRPAACFVALRVGGEGQFPALAIPGGSEVMISRYRGRLSHLYIVAGRACAGCQKEPFQDVLLLLDHSTRT
jgi:hypothetical protein